MLEQTEESNATDISLKLSKPKIYGKIGREGMESLLVAFLTKDEQREIDNEMNKSEELDEDAKQVANSSIDGYMFKSKFTGSVFDAIKEEYLRTKSRMTPSEISHYLASKELHTPDQSNAMAAEIETARSSFLLMRVRAEYIIKDFLTLYSSEKAEKLFVKYQKDRNNPNIGPNRALELHKDALENLTRKASSGCLVKVESFNPEQLCELTTDEVQWIWDGYIANRSITLLHGKMKEGKSTLLFAFFRNLFQSNAFLERATSKCGVVFLTEEPIESLSEKIRQFELIGTNIETIPNRMYPGLKLNGAREPIKAACEKVSAGLIVIDTLSAWSGWGADDENKSGPVEKTMDTLKDIAKENDCAIVIVHHSKKSSSDDAVNGARGSSALTGAVDNILFLCKDPSKCTNDNQRVLRAKGRLAGIPDEVKIELNEEQTDFRCFTNNFDNLEKYKTLLDAIPLIYPGQTREEIAQKIGWKMGRVRNGLSILLGAKSIERNGSGQRSEPYRYYKPTDKVVKQLEESNTTTTTSSITKHSQFGWDFEYIEENNYLQ